MTRIALVFAVALSICASAAMAQDYSIGTIQVAKPWSSRDPQGGKGCRRLHDHHQQGHCPLIAWLAAQLPAASGFEVHSMVMEQGVAKMRPVEGGLEIKPGETSNSSPDRST